MASRSNHGIEMYHQDREIEKRRFQGRERVLRPSKHETVIHLRDREIEQRRSPGQEIVKRRSREETTTSHQDAETMILHRDHHANKMGCQNES